MSIRRIMICIKEVSTMKKKANPARRLFSLLLALILCFGMTVNLGVLTSSAKNYRFNEHIYVGDLSVGDIVDNGVTLHSTGEAQEYEGFTSFKVYFYGEMINVGQYYEVKFDRRGMLVAAEVSQNNPGRIHLYFEDFYSEGNADSEGTLKASLMNDNAVILSGDIELNSCVEINDGREHVIYTNGYTISRRPHGKSDDGGLFRLTGGSTLTIKDLSADGSTFLSGGSAKEGGCIYVAGKSKLTLYNIKIIGNTANAGGGICIKEGTAELNRCTFESNSADENGGALYVDTAASATLTDCRIEGSNGYDGGGIYNLGKLTVKDTVITDNIANGGGAGIWSKGDASIEKTEITNNKNAVNGGGIINHKNMTISECNISENNVSSCGGGIYIDATGKTEIKKSCLFGGNTASNGAGIYLHKGELTVSESTLENNVVTEAGGGLWANEYTTATLTDCAIQNNTCKTNGGGINSHGTLNIKGCLINACSADNCGGAVYMDTSEWLTIEDCEITNCRSAKGGAGIYFYNGLLKLAGGKIIVADNIKDGSADNVAARFFKRITVTGQLAEGSKIGFLPPKNSGDATFTTGYGKYNETEPEKIFSCDDNGYRVAFDSKTGECRLLERVNTSFSSYKVKVHIKVTNDADWWDYAYIRLYAKDNKGLGSERLVKTTGDIQKSLDDEDEEYTFEYDCGENKFPSAVEVVTSFGSWGTWRDFEADVKVYINGINTVSQHIVHKVYGDEEKITKIHIGGDKYPYPDDFEVDMAKTIDPHEEESRIITVSAVDQYGLTWKANSENASMENISFPENDTFEPVDDSGLKWKLNSTYENNHQSTYELTFKSGSNVYPKITKTINVEFAFKLYLKVMVGDQEVMTAEGYNGDSINIAGIKAPTGYYINGYTNEGVGIISKNGENDYDFVFVNDSVTLTAKLRPITYKIAYDKNVPEEEKSSVKGAISNRTATYGTSVKLEKNRFTRKGYRFVGWNTQADGMGTMYKEQEYVNNLTSEKGAILTMYAIWQPTGAATTASIFSYGPGFIIVAGIVIFIIGAAAAVLYSVNKKRSGKSRTGVE